MKLNIANPSTGAQMKLEIEDPKQLNAFYERRIGQEIDGAALGEQWKGYIFKIMGGNDKQGFPMMQGVLLPSRVKLMLDKNSKCYRARRTGERKRKSIRGCIVGPDISVLSLIVAKKGAEEVPGLTDKVVPRRLGPKRASRIRKLFNLSTKDDVRQYVIRREIPTKEGKKRSQTKAPKIQRLVTPSVLQRKRRRKALKQRQFAKVKAETAAYAKLIAQRNKEKRQALISKKRSLSVKAEAGKKDAAKKPAAAGKKDAKKDAAKKPAAAGKKDAAAAKKGQAKPAAADAKGKKAAAKPAAAKKAEKKAPAAAKKPAAKKGKGK